MRVRVCVVRGETRVTHPRSAVNALAAIVFTAWKSGSDRENLGAYVDMTSPPLLLVEWGVCR